MFKNKMERKKTMMLKEEINDQDICTAKLASFFFFLLSGGAQTKKTKCNEEEEKTNQSVSIA